MALIGQGPDELFCGYKRHIGVRYGESWRGSAGTGAAPHRRSGQPAAAQRDDEARRLRARHRRPAAALPARVLARPGRI